MRANLNLGTTLAIQVHPMRHHLDRHHLDRHHLDRHHLRTEQVGVAHKPTLTRTTRTNVRPTPYRSVLCSFDLVHCTDSSLCFACSHVSFGFRFLPRLFATD